MAQIKARIALNQMTAPRQRLDDFFASASIPERFDVRNAGRRPDMPALSRSISLGRKGKPAFA